MNNVYFGSNKINKREMDNLKFLTHFSDTDTNLMYNFINDYALKINNIGAYEYTITDIDYNNTTYQQVYVYTLPDNAFYILHYINDWSEHNG